jgi:hypothetical protein
LYFIDSQAVTLLQQLFPTWTPIASDSETCAICDAEVHISKEDKREIRKRVEEEKVVLILNLDLVYPRTEIRHTGPTEVFA